jgi:hypothetical protein
MARISNNEYSLPILQIFYHNGKDFLQFLQKNYRILKRPKLLSNTSAATDFTKSSSSTATSVTKNSTFTEVRSDPIL